MRSRLPRAPSTQSSSGGDLLEPGYGSNYGERKRANFIYLTATLDAPTWGAELAVGEGPGRIYRVEPIGPIEDDPNLTDKKFPGNPTRSYRTRRPLRVVSEVLDWEGHPPDVLQAMLDHLEELKQLGIEAINDRARSAILQRAPHRDGNSLASSSSLISCKVDLNLVRKSTAG